MSDRRCAPRSPVRAGLGAPSTFTGDRPAVADDVARIRASPRVTAILARRRTRGRSRPPRAPMCSASDDPAHLAVLLTGGLDEVGGGDRAAGLGGDQRGAQRGLLDVA